jgi:uncharacterized membrane protein YfcA
MLWIPMIIASTTALLLVALGVFSGVLGALVGIGGGIIVVPALVTVVATSTTAGSVYVGKGLANMRLGMSLEVATTLGGLSGGLSAALISPSILAGLFAAMMGVTAALLLRKQKEANSKGVLNERPVSHLSGTLQEPGALTGSYFDDEKQQLVEYRAEKLWLGGGVSFFAGVISGLLGVGGGFIKVPAMHLGMRVPIKVAAATSNFMIGCTAISSLFVYLARGYVHPAIAAPVALGTAAGSLYGTRLAKTVSAKTLKYLLAAILLGVGVQMLLRALGVGHGR